MTYNTGNPIGSTDARDRLDNSENMDILENSTTLNAHADRLGTMRKTRKGMELEHDNQMQSFENDFDSRLASMAFTRVGTFTAGATLTDMRQTLLWEISQGGDGREYGWTGSFLPAGKVVAAGSSPGTSGGVGTGAWVDRTDERIRSDLNVVIKTFASASAMVADTALVVGQIVETLSYHDGWLATIDPPKGGNKYEIVAGSTGTADGGSFIALSNGLQAKGLFVDGIVNVCQFGIRPDVTTDQSSKLQSIIYFSTNTGTKLIGNKLTCYVSSQIIIPPTLFADWSGLKIKYHPSFSGGTGSIVSLEMGTSSASWSKGSPLDNLKIEGTAGNLPDQSFTTDGIYIGGVGMQTSDIEINNIQVTGFRDCVNIKGPSSYLITFNNPQIGVANRRALSYTASSDSGENIRVFGGSLYNCVNTTFNAVGFYLSSEASTLDITFTNTSFDYSDISIYQYHSFVTCVSCHFENNSNNPHVKLDATTSKARTSFRMIGGNLGGGPLGSTPPFGNPIEDATGRPWYVEILGTSVNVEIDKVSVGGYKPTGQKTEIVHRTTTEMERKVSINVNMDAGADVPASWPCSLYFKQNALHLGENGSKTGWSTTGNLEHWIEVTDVKANHDTGSRKHSSSVTSAELHQDVPCVPGTICIAKVWIKTLGLTSGYATARLQFYANDGVTILSDKIFPRRVTADSTELTEVAWIGIVPNGAKTVRFLDYFAGAPGTPIEVWYTGEQVWFM